MVTICAASGYVSPTRFLSRHPFSPSALPDLIAPIGASDFPELAKLFVTLK